MMRRYGFCSIYSKIYLWNKTLIPLAMGLTKYSATKFTILNALATIIWACVVGYLSYTAGSYILTLSEDFKYFGLAVVLLIF